MAQTSDGSVEPLEFSCTRDDFLDAQRLHHTRSLVGRRFILLIGATAVGMGVLLASVARDPEANPIEYGLVCAAFYLGAMAVFILINRFLILPRASLRQFLQLKEFRSPLKIAVDPPQIGISTKNGFSKMPTEDFIKWTENSKAILLYRSDRQFNFIPKRVISSQFHCALVAELTRAGVPKAKFTNS